MSLAIINPPGWPRPRGYSNGVIASGRRLHIAGQHCDALVPRESLQSFLQEERLPRPG